MIETDVKAVRVRFNRSDRCVELVVNEGIRLRFDGHEEAEETGQQLIKQTAKIGGQQTL